MVENHIKLLQDSIQNNKIPDAAVLVQIKQQLDYKTQYTSQFRTRKGMQYIFAIMPKILSKLQLLGQKPFIEAQSETKLSEEQEKEIKY